MLPNAAELHCRQIAPGLDGAHAQILLKSRLAIRELLGQIWLEPGEDGSLWAAYEVHPAVLVRNAVSGFAGWPDYPVPAIAVRVRVKQRSAALHGIRACAKPP